MVSVRLNGSGADNLEYRVMDLDSSSSWLDIISIVSLLYFSLNSVGGIYFKDALFAIWLDEWFFFHVIFSDYHNFA